MGTSTYKFRSKGKVFAEDYTTSITLLNGDCLVHQDFEDRKGEYECTWFYTSLAEAMEQSEKLANKVEGCLATRARTLKMEHGGTVYKIPWTQEQKGVEFRINSRQRKSKSGLRNLVSLDVTLED
jgi:hypothetical protein